MKERLTAIVNRIRKDPSVFTWDEASIKNGVVLPLLSNLGWNPFDVNEVKPEHTVKSQRVDYSLRLNGTNKVFIEVKRSNESLEPHQEQLLNYSFREGVKLAVLTNGLTWWFYLPLNEGSWEQRRFYTADSLEQHPESIAERLIELLAKSNIASGKAVDNAENIIKTGRKIGILKEAIPKAWHKIISDPDDLLVELLIEATEKLCGFRPDIDDVEEFLKNLLTKKAPSPGPRPGPKPPKPKPGDYVGKKVRAFTLLGRTHHPRSWRELLVTVAEEMYRRHTSDFDRCLSLRGPKMVYFSKGGNELHQPAQIAGSSYFVETCFNANSTVKRSRELMALFGYEHGDLNITAE